MRFFGMIWDAWDDAMRIEIIKYLRAAAPAADPGRRPRKNGQLTSLFSDSVDSALPRYDHL